MAKVIIKDISISNHHQLMMTESDVASFTTLKACPICGATGKDIDALHLGHEDWVHRVRLVVCGECASIYYANPPDENYIKRYYVASWNHTNEGGEIWNNSRVAPREKMSKFMVDAGLTNPDLRIFDFGCGKGGLLLGLQKVGFRNLYGSELSPARAAKTNTYFPGQIFCGSDDELPTNIKFDLIYSNHVIEHTYCPRSTIEKLLSKLSDDGVLVIFVPDSRYELVANQTLFLPHLHSLTYRAFKLIASNLGLEVTFWRRARSDEICVVLGRKLNRINFSERMFFDSNNAPEESSVQQVQRIRQMWNLSVQKGGAYLACNSAVHNLLSIEQKKQGYAVISRTQAKVLKIGECLALRLKLLGFVRLSNFMSLLYTKMSKEGNQLVGWRFVHAVGEGDTNLIPVIGILGNKICFTVK